jgi:hypothetical protein
MTFIIWSVTVQHTNKQKYVYLLSAYHMIPCGYLKIGITQNFKNRASQIQSSSPFYIITECVVESEDPFSLEQDILSEFKQYRIRGEWFSVYSRIGDDDVVKKSYLLTKKIKKYMVKNSIRRIE